MYFIVLPRQGPHKRKWKPQSRKFNLMVSGMISLRNWCKLRPKNWDGIHKAKKRKKRGGEASAKVLWQQVWVTKRKVSLFGLHWERRCAGNVKLEGSAAHSLWCLPGLIKIPPCPPLIWRLAKSFMQGSRGRFTFWTHHFAAVYLQWLVTDQLEDMSPGKRQWHPGVGWRQQRWR